VKHVGVHYGRLWDEGKPISWQMLYVYALMTVAKQAGLVPGAEIRAAVEEAIKVVVLHCQFLFHLRSSHSRNPVPAC